MSASASRLVALKAPATFVVDWGLPTAAELGYGYRQGWLRPRDLVDIAPA
jgi:hypothetical protein